MENVMRLEHHTLIPRFALLRLSDPQRLRRLVRSIERNGQLTPLVAVLDPQQAMQWIVIDGYQRLEALRQIGEDLVWVDVWDHAVDEALLLCLARGSERAWEAIEEGALIDELAQRFSLHEIARRIGRDVSWVSRRLTLFKALPEALLAKVRQGEISVWAAERILAPLARANADHAHTLLTQLEQHPLSTRELKTLYTHYQQANKTQRDRLIKNPALFVQALTNTQQDRQAQALGEGAEGAWCKDLRIIARILARLHPQVPTLFGPQQDAAEKQRLRQPFRHAQSAFQALANALEEAAS